MKVFIGTYHTIQSNSMEKFSQNTPTKKQSSNHQNVHQKQNQPLPPPHLSSAKDQIQMKKQSSTIKKVPPTTYRNTPLRYN